MLKLIEGMDQLTSVTDLAMMRHTWTGTLNFFPTGGRFGGRGIQVPAATANQVRFTQEPIDVDAGAGHWAFYIKFDSLPSNEQIFMSIRNESAVSSPDYGIVLATNASGDLILKRYGPGGTTNAGETAAAAITTGVWHHIEIDYLVRASDGHIRGYIDGIQVVDYSGNTIYLNSDGKFGLDTIYFTGRTGMVMIVDDVVAWDEEGADFIKPLLGEHRIETRTPDGDVSTMFEPSTGSDNFNMVNEDDGSDRDGTYVQSTAVDDMDLYSLANLGRTPVEVHAVAIKTAAKKTDIGDVEMRHVLKSGTTTVESASIVLPASYTGSMTYWGLDPHTSAPFLPSALDDLEIGVKYHA